MCDNSCMVCRRLVVSNSVTFAGGNVIINIPEGVYAAGCKYCIMLNQPMPTTATVGAPVFVTIGAGTTQYPLNKCDCTQATVCSMRTREIYPVRVQTTPTGGSFKLLRKICCAPDNNLASLPVAAAAEAGGGA